jgi:enoyl-CoA hydratase/carnithine racemase
MSQITLEKQNQVLVIQFNRPEKMNALTRDMYGDLAKALKDAAEDFSIRTVVLSSHGDHFTAGNDIGDFMSNPPTAEDSTVAAFLQSILEFPKPLIAAVKGNAVGVGTTMLLHCDLVYASPNARFSLPFTSLGLVPEAGSTLLLQQLVGYQRAAKLFFTGETFTPDYAHQIGLVTEIAEDPLHEAIAVATKIADQPPTAIINTKALMKASTHDPVAAVMQAEFQIFALALQSEEAAEAFMKFISKKKA